MDLTNIEGQQRIISKFNALFFKHPPSSYSSPEVQKSFVKILHKNFKPDSWEKTDIEASGLPRNTVREWIIAFITVRLNALQIVEKAKRFGCVYQSADTDASYNLKNKRPREGEAPEKNTNRDAKRLDTKKGENRKGVFIEEGHCFICGRLGHDQKDCYRDNELHPDRNLESRPFNHSTKGKQWLDISQRNGPFVHRDFLLNGTRIVPSTGGQKPTRKYNNVHISSVFNAIENYDNAISDFLTVRISLPITQTVNRLQAGVEAGAMVEAGAIGMLDEGVVDPDA